MSRSRSSLLCTRAWTRWMQSGPWRSSLRLSTMLKIRVSPHQLEHEHGEYANYIGRQSRRLSESSSPAPRSMSSRPREHPCVPILTTPKP